MKNAASIDATIGGGMHRHLALALTPAIYLQVTGHAFAPPVNPGPNPVIPTPYLMVQKADQIRQNHHNELIAYHKYANTNKALQAQLTDDINNRYLKAMNQNMLEYNNCEVRELLEHLYQNYG
eukprot:3354237-Ditylum_brightwellii.AAC.1